MTEQKIYHENVAILIPAFNESDTIFSVVSKASLFGKPIVIDDGSSDDTGPNALLAGALVITHGLNRGYDAALASGLEKSIADGFDFAITIDGDGQHDSSVVNNILHELKYGADVVIGKRDKFQRCSETIFAHVSKRFWGISDPLCGVKGYKLSRLRSLECLCSYESIGTELVICAAKLDWNIRQVPVVTFPRNGDSRFGTGIIANSKIIFALVRAILAR
jgi:glycosyltransferase involved in cell wall biosynthesis